MKDKEKSRPLLAPGGDLSLACSFAFAGSSLVCLDKESQNDDLLVINEDCSKVMKGLQEELSCKFTPKKKRSFMLSDVYLELGYKKRARLVSDCGSFLEFKVSDRDKKLNASKHLDFVIFKKVVFCNFFDCLEVCWMFVLVLWLLSWLSFFVAIGEGTTTLPYGVHCSRTIFLKKISESIVLQWIEGFF